MSVKIACFGCGESFDARRFAGLVRCGSCEDRAAPRLEAAEATRVTFDTPGEAWA